MRHKRFEVGLVHRCDFSLRNCGGRCIEAIKSRTAAPARFVEQVRGHHGLRLAKGYDPGL